MRRIAIAIAALAAFASMLVGFSASAALAAGTPVFDPTAAPQGTHVQTGAPSCSFAADGLTVVCSSFELAGVGNTNATATLATTYEATVDCQNRGGNIVEVKAQLETVPATTGQLEPKNGRLTVPSLTS